jgi:hypothetical protein
MIVSVPHQLTASPFKLLEFVKSIDRNIVGELTISRCCSGQRSAIGAIKDKVSGLVNSIEQII